MFNLLRASEQYATDDAMFASLRTEDFKKWPTNYATMLKTIEGLKTKLTFDGGCAKVAFILNSFTAGITVNNEIQRQLYTVIQATASFASMTVTGFGAAQVIPMTMLIGATVRNLNQAISGMLSDQADSATFRSTVVLGLVKLLQGSLVVASPEKDKNAPKPVITDEFVFQDLHYHEGKCGPQIDKLIEYFALLFGTEVEGKTEQYFREKIAECAPQPRWWIYSEPYRYKAVLDLQRTFVENVAQPSGGGTKKGSN